MTEIIADGGPLLPVPDDVTVSQFVLDSQHPTRPTWNFSRPWLIEEATGREIGSDELRSRVHGLANALKIRWNIKRDDVVCLLSPNHVDYVVAMWAVQALGGVVATANPMYTTEELQYLLRLTKAGMILAHPVVLPVARDAARACGIPEARIISFEPIADSPIANIQDLVKVGLREPQQYTELRLKPGEAKKKLAVLSFSSGTTGRPKAALITHYCFVSNLVQVGQYFRLNDESVPLSQRIYKPGSITLGVLPFFHSYGMHMVLFGSLYLRSTLLVSPRFQLERMLESIQRYKITHLFIVPPQMVLLCKSPSVSKYDLSSVYFLMGGAAPISAELTEQLARVLPNSVIGQGYGMTESVTTVALLQLDMKVGTLGSAGVLIPGWTARVVRADGTLAGYNETGELHLKGPSLCLGYLDNPTASAETFKDGWLCTGDEVKINERKEIFVVDRIKELIKVRGFQVAPSELEGHLLDYPDIDDVCVVGIPDDFSIELPFAFIVLSPRVRERVKADATTAESMRNAVLKHVSDHKTRYKWLAGLEFVDAVPKNPSGKLLRRVLRQQAKEKHARGELRIVTRSKL